MTKRLVFDSDMADVWRKGSWEGEWTGGRLWQAVQDAMYFAEGAARHRLTGREWQSAHEEFADRAERLAAEIEKRIGDDFDPWPYEFREFAALARERANQPPPAAAKQPNRATAKRTACVRRLAQNLRSLFESAPRLAYARHRVVATLTNAALRISRTSGAITADEVREILRGKVA
ncbi:MAG: hypothetical protein HY943_11635 [Gammaproteobacteria bacterium]|nr:hypothetical protein [Gammaproteobacteria bacterium]